MKASIPDLSRYTDSAPLVSLLSNDFALYTTISANDFRDFLGNDVWLLFTHTYVNSKREFPLYGRVYL